MQVHEKYHIINRNGNLTHSDIGVFSLVSHAEILLSYYNCSSYIYNLTKDSKKSLPPFIENKETLFYPVLYPQSQLIVGYNISPSKKYYDSPGIPQGKNIIASFALDSNANLLFSPIPLFIYEFGNEWLIACNKQKNLFLLNIKGEIIHSYPKRLRLQHFYIDNSGNISEMIVYKVSDSNSQKLPLYHIDVQTGIIHGPYLKIGRFQEGQRCVKTMDEKLLFLDQDWNEVLSLAHLQKNKDVMVISECSHGHIAIFICGEGKCILYDNEGHKILGPRYTNLIHVNKDIWFYEKRGKLGLMHESGELITPPQFFNNGLSIHGFSHGLIPVGTKISPNKKIKWGYINDKGEWMIPPQFNNAFSFFHPNYAAVR